MKNLLLSILLVVATTINAQKIYRAMHAEITFFSKTPLENIDGTNNDAKSIISTKNNEIAFAAAIIGFHFEKPLMEEHFNEDYMESEKYKSASFKGKIIGDVNYEKDGVYPVKVKGILKIHGVEKERVIPGTITIKNGKLSLLSEFNVKLEDHKVKVPKIVTKKIAESVKVTVKANFEEKVKK